MNLTITNDMIINYMHNGVTYPLNNLIFRQNGVDNVVYTKPQPHDYSQDYFTIENIDSSSSTNLVFYTGANKAIDIYYSTNDGQTWTTKKLTGGMNYYNNDIYISTGQKMLFKCWYSNSYSKVSSSNYMLKFKLTRGQCKIYGNIASLCTSMYSDFTQTTTPTIFSGFFCDSTAIVDASNLIFPQDVINWCYENMFNNCTNLVSGPKELPATTLAQACYQYMFNGCTSLTKSPFLPATTLTQECYRYMFNGCTSLNEITCLAKKKSATNCLQSWVYNVSSSGTFYKKSDASWSAGTNGYPSGWTITNYVA